MLDELIESLFQKHGTDVAKVRAAAVSAARGVPKLWESAALRGIDDAIRSAIHAFRGKVSSDEDEATKDRDTIKKFRARRGTARLTPGPLYWPLPSGKPIGQATIDDLDVAYTVFDQNARGNASSRDFVDAVRKRMATLKAKPMDKVADVVGASVVARLFSATKGA